MDKTSEAAALEIAESSMIQLQKQTTKAYCQLIGRKTHALIFDEDGKIVVAIDDSKPHVNKNNAFDWERPDSHTLDVVDQKDQRVLHIRFLNPKAVYVEGIFFNSIGVKIAASKDALTISPPHRPKEIRD